MKYIETLELARKIFLGVKQEKSVQNRMNLTKVNAKKRNTGSDRVLFVGRINSY